MFDRTTANEWGEAPLPFQLLDEQGRITDVNCAWEEFTGYTADEVRGVPYADLIPVERRGDFERNMAALRRDGHLEGAPCYITRKDGEVRGVVVFARVSSADDGIITRCILVDTGLQREAERRIAESELRFRGLFELAPTPIVIHDGTTITLANTAAATFLGVDSVDELIGSKVARFVHPDSIPQIAERIGRMMAEEWVAPLSEEMYVRADGQVVYGETIASPVTDSGRRLIQVIALDTSARRHTEAQLDEYRRELERLVEERTQRLDRARADLAAITAVVGRTVELRDPYTAGHQRRVAELAVAIARQMGMSEESVEALDVAARLHDVGKVAVPAEILSKPSTLSGLEYELVKTHAQAGFELVASAELHEPISTIVHQHHERLDGSGYPNGLAGDALLPESRVLMVADVFEAMASHRPYRAALGADSAVAELTRGMGTIYDPDVVNACISLVGDGFRFADDA